MKFSTACVLAYASFACAAPAPQPEDDDCSSKVVNAHHQHKRAVVTEVTVVTVTLDDSATLLSTATPSLLSLAQEVPQMASSAPAPEAASSAAPASGSSSGSTLANYQPPSQVFVDGVYDCAAPPTFEGVVPVTSVNYGGWSGIQAVDGTHANAAACTEGHYCSYLCQPGMSKTQWPAYQPASGQSLGGLECKNGKLYRTNTNTNFLCEWGVDKAIVDNQLSQGVAICRTDYPGTEEMDVATFVPGKSQSPITVVDLETYYQWLGKKTSAQYYVNQPGVSQADGCKWSSAEAGTGNWAPMNFGAGYDNNIGWLSLIPNPNNRQPFNSNIKIVAEDSDSIVIGSCVYENGQYSGGSDGCTVSVTKGRGKFVFY